MPKNLGSCLRFPLLHGNIPRKTFMSCFATAFLIIFTAASLEATRKVGWTTNELGLDWLGHLTTIQNLEQQGDTDCSF
jgi:hypothetical protein